MILEQLPRLAHQTAREIADVMIEEYVMTLQPLPDRSVITARLNSILSLYAPELEQYRLTLEPLLGADGAKQVIEQWRCHVQSLAGIMIIKETDNIINL